MDAVAAHDEQFTIIERADGEFDVMQSKGLDDEEMEGEEEEVTYVFEKEPVKRGRGRPRKNK